MPDPADERAAYREALARAEQAALAELETPAPEADELAGAVPVVASDQPLPTEETTPEAEAPAEEVVAETAPAEAEAPETVEQLRERLAAAEARLAEKDTFIGRQSSEVGELRQVVDALSQRLEVVAQPQPAPTAVTPITQDLIDNDPATATILAFNQRDEMGLKRAFDAWSDPVTGNPAAAASWLADRKIEQAAAAQRAEFEALKAEIESVKAPQAQQAVRDEWQKAFSIVQKDHEDFLTNAERILVEVAPQYPAFADTLGNGTAEQKADVLRALYTIDRANRTDPAAVKQELEAAANEAASEEAAALAAAAVVSGQPTAGLSNAPDLSYEEQEQERYKQRFSGGVSLDRGWTRRSAN